MSKPTLLIGNEECFKVFGHFNYKVVNKAGDIEILGDWVKTNIIPVYIPQLKGIKGAPKSCEVLFHRVASEALACLFKNLEASDLLRYVLSLNGTFNPRLIRGSTTTISHHCFGAAIDLNAEWNPLGGESATGKGTLLPIIPLANLNGFAWGGDYHGRKDPMHFEFCPPEKKK